MNFIVTYRAKDGSRTEGNFEAADRAALFAELKTQGISPIAVKEGPARKRTASKSPRVTAKGGGKPFGKGLLALIIIVVLGGAVIYLMIPSAPVIEPVEETKPQQPKVLEEVQAAAAAEAEEAPAPDEATERARRREMFKKMTPDEKRDYLLKQMQDRPLPSEPASNRVFRTGVEQVMSWIFTTELGNPPPLLPNISLYDQVHLAEILISDDPIKETDSDTAKDAKDMVQLAKKEFREFLKEGGNPDDFLPYYHDQLKAAHAEYQEARKQAIETLRENPDITADYLKSVNKRLAEKGIKKVTLPPKLLEKYGVEINDDAE